MNKKFLGLNSGPAAWLCWLGLLLVAWPAEAQEKENAEASASTQVVWNVCQLQVGGMSCGGCAGMVEAGLTEIEGVKTATVDWKSGHVKVEYDPKKLTPEKLVRVFNERNPGFRAEVRKPAKAKQRKKPSAEM